MIELRLKYPPSINAMWRTGRGRMFRSKKYEAWRAEAMAEIMVQKPDKIKGEYTLIVMAHRPDKRRRDIDNIGFKAISDVLTEMGVIQDDSLAHMVTASWMPASAKGEGVIVRVSKWPI